MVPSLRLSPALILDLDDTTVDTSRIAHLRKAPWKNAVAKLSLTSAYEGIKDVLDRLAEREIKIGIVTNSVSYYAQRVLARHQIPYHCLVAYHDTDNHKPNPEPVLKCLQTLKCSADTSLGVGDTEDDATAYRAAGLKAWGAGWSEALVTDAKWHQVAQTPSELLKHFRL